ncbi:MAG TPA: Gfo/Idh/MocA family oxidoreductase [Bryobacteraceae bacterium]|jgi:predicted dehydrogenase|nr:Gfo/Idh/MocA family oxidoreductase [Bryobacteraceae bacterium]
MNRRTFLVGASGAMWAGAAPSGRLSVGVIGPGGRGRFLMERFGRDAAVRLTAVCDVYEPNLEAGLSLAKGGAKAYRHYKELLSDKNVDIVIIATPEHWHHQMLLDALAAGKDVYVEKPLCHTPEQGVELMREARNSDRIVQVGMQRRSYPLYLQARDVRAAGTLGNVRLVRTWWINNSLTGGTDRKLDGPLDWEQWQGPAPRHPMELGRFRNWRNYRDYAGGIVADQGAHIYDSIHLIRGVGFPMAVNASAGRVHSTAGDTPETVVVVAEYPEDFLGVFTINYAGMHYPGRMDQLNQFDGDEARMDVGREFLSVYKQADPETPAITAKGSFDTATDAHIQNFLECVRTRKEPNATVEKGFQAALVIHLANLSLQTGRRIKWNAQTQKAEV